MKHSTSLKNWKDEIVEVHLNQDYGVLDKPMDFGKILDRFHLFPNEALYVIDCLHAQLEPLSKNFNEIIGIERNNKNDLLLLYDHVAETNQPALHHWVMNNLNTAFNMNGFVKERDIFKCIYKTYQGKTLLKITMGLQFDSAGKMRYTLGKLIDLTGLTVFQHFDYQYEGPNKDVFYDAYHQRNQGSSILTKRETEILILLGEGFTSQVIASKLFISVHTVDTHRRNIIEKMETTSALEAYRKCKNMGWL